MTCFPPKHHTRIKQSVIAFLQSHNLLSVRDAHCHHCGCLWDTTENSPFCLRCRSAFYFILPNTLTVQPSEGITIDEDQEHEEVRDEDEDEKEMNRQGKRRKLSPKPRIIPHVQRCYRWCDGCKEYHWSG